MAHILVVEDNVDLNALLVQALTDQGHRVRGVHDGLQAREALTDDVDLVLLDIMLPLINGASLLEQWRRTTDIPVIVVSAKDATWTKIDLLKLGADDYVTKPFDLGEVCARVEALLRRSRPAPTPDPVVRWGHLAYDPGAATLAVAGTEVALTATEFRLLGLLLDHPGQVFSKARIHEHLWDEPYAGDDGAIKTHVSNLRTKIRRAEAFDYIETVWGLGYRLTRTPPAPADGSPGPDDS